MLRFVVIQLIEQWIKQQQAACERDASDENRSYEESL